MSTSKAQSAKANAETKKLNQDALDALNALKLSAKVGEKNGKKSIFKSAYNDKALRTKYRNALMKVTKIEISDGQTEDVQKGLIPTFLMQLQKGKMEDAMKTFSEIKEICKKVYVAEDSFTDANDYFSSNRSESTQQILKTFITVAQSL